MEDNKNIDTSMTEEVLETSISIVSVGPDREQTIFRG